MSVSPGSKVTLLCEATGIPRPVGKWYKDGLPVSRKNTVRVKGMVSFLSLESVTTLHQGIYWCEARNVEGWKRSSRTTLVLKRSKNQFSLVALFIFKTDLLNLETKAKHHLKGHFLPPRWYVVVCIYYSILRYVCFVTFVYIVVFYLVGNLFKL